MTQTQSPLGAFFRTVNRVTDIAAILMTVAILVVVVIQITGRLADRPAPWTEEATRVFFICMIYLGIGIGFRRGESARVTVFLDWLPAWVRRQAIWIYVVSTVGFFVFMLYTGIQLVVQQYTMNELGAAFMIPMWWVGLFVPLSAVLGILGVAENILFYRELLEGGE